MFFMKTPIITTKKELEEAIQKAEENLLGWKRAMADYQNLEKKTAREREAFTQFAAEQIIRDILPTLDQAGRAMEQAPKDEWTKGVQMIFENLHDTLRSHGVKKMEVIGKKFDPAYHESLESRKEGGKEPGIILEEKRAGYLLHNRVLRPAQVIISE